MLRKVSSVSSLEESAKSSHKEAEVVTEEKSTFCFVEILLLLRVSCCSTCTRLRLEEFILLEKEVLQWD
jgi:molybdenum cofactor biosynthesis enzyme MoaA